jgi:hypothetical protein
MKINNSKMFIYIFVNILTKINNPKIFRHFFKYSYKNKQFKIVY